MKHSHYKLLIKHKKIIQERIEMQLAQLRLSAQQLRQEYESNIKKIENLYQYNEVSTIFELHNMYKNIEGLKKRNNALQQQLQDITTKIETLQKELTQIHAQKKSLEKLSQRVQQFQMKQQREQENRLANENYAYKKFFHH